MRGNRAGASAALSVLLGAAIVFAGACGGEPSGAGPNRPPVVALTSPAVGALFAGGDSLDITTTASDPEDGALTGDAVEWWVVLHHDTHTHPFAPMTTGVTGRVGIPRVGHETGDIFLRVHARAVDAAGVADSTFTDVMPRVTTLTLTTTPAGLQVTLDGQPRTTPYAESAIVGMLRPVGIPTGQRRGDANFTFSSWSSGAAESHSLLIAAAPLLLTATFDSTIVANVAPTVSLIAPSAGASLTVGDAVTLTAATTDSDGTVQQVEFFADGESVGVDDAAPFTLVWTPASTGARTLTARATDDDGAFTTSAGIAVTVQAATGDVLAPVTTLVTPAAGTLGLTGAVTLTATATDNVGVTAVEFQVDGAPLATDDTAPFEAILPSTAAYASGAHVMRARARDAAGNWSPWSASSVTFGGSVALPQGFVRTTVASGLNATPTAMAFAPDGRLFVAEQTGALRVVKNGVLLAEPFVTLAVNAIGERGLLGIAFDPGFATNGWIYLYYTTSAGGVHNRISRFTANGDIVAAGSEVVLVDLPMVSDSRRHNGGAMRFGADGMLYVAVGDDAVSANAPSLAVPFGKMLRFGPDGSIPSDNPFYAATTGVNRAIWAKGLRNPYTFDIHPTTGRMHINDVGQSTWEEINLGRSGADYGWPDHEGPTAAVGFDAPLFAYRHETSPTLFEGFAVVGAAFYAPTDPMFGATYVDDFFFADYVNGWIYRLDAQADWAPYAFAHLGAFTTGLTVGDDGALYVLVGTRVDRIAR